MAVWTEQEDKLLLKLTKKRVRYAELVDYFENRTEDAIRTRVFRLREQDKNDWVDDALVAAFDIETTDLKADVGFMLSWYMVRSDGKEVGARISKKEILDGTFDKRLLEKFIEEVSKVDMIVGYYSTKFDVPFLRTRCELQGLDFPRYGTVLHMDLYYLARAKLKLRNNRLATVVDALELDSGEKTGVAFRRWMLARYGHQGAINEIFNYCKQDVRITYDAFERLRKYRRITRKSI